MVEKLFNVFVSSTYADLAEERRFVSNALSKAGFVVVGMEIFPASNREQFDFIKKMIDRCDYYVVIVGGRYGSLADGNISYTEKEYEYALSRGMPVLAFLHRQPEDIEVKKTDNSKKLAAKLKKFRDKLATGRIVEFWTHPHELSGLVVSAVAHTSLDAPQIGWVRGNLLAKYASEPPLKSIEKWQHSWESVSKKYEGTYVFYYRTLSESGTVAICLLEIRQGSTGRVEFKLFNVDDRYLIVDSPTIYTYNGYVFPINDCLYFFGDEDSLDEMMCIIMSSSQVSPPSNLSGYMMAIGVRPGVRMPVGSTAVAMFKSRDFPGLASMLPHLGIVPNEKIPKNVGRLLKIE